MNRQVFALKRAVLFASLLLISSATSACIRRSSNMNHSHYYFGYFENAGSSNPSILLISNEINSVAYSIDIPGTQCNSSFFTNERKISLPDSVISSTEQGTGIYANIQSDRVSMIGQNANSRNSDTFLVLPVPEPAPNVTNNTRKFVYYGVSVAVTVSAYFGRILIVGTEDNTNVSITNENAGFRIDNGNDNTSTEYHCVINRLETVSIRSHNDLTGTKIVTNCEVAVFSGHQGGSVVGTEENERHDHLIEQIPSTAFWGREYFIAPLKTRNVYSIKILAAHNFTSVVIYCNGSTETLIIEREGNFTTKTFEDQRYRAIYSNNSILVVQFSHLQRNRGGTMMTLVPATTHYLNRLDFSTIQRRSDNYNHYINIIVMEQHYQPEMICLKAGGKNESLKSKNLSPVPISVNGSCKAFAIQVDVPEGVVQVVHANRSALITVISYGFASHAAYGHPAGLKLIDPCDPNPCGDSGECIVDGNSYLCNCSNGENVTTSCLIPTTIPPVTNSPELCNTTEHLEQLQSASCSSNSFLIDFTQKVTENDTELNALICNLTVSTCTNESSASSEEIMNTVTLLELIVASIEQDPNLLSSNEIVEEILESFSNVTSPNNNAGWKELERMNLGQSQLLLNSSERFGILLAENLNRGLTPTVTSENIIIEAMLVNTDASGNIVFPDTDVTSDVSNSIEIPASFIQHRSDFTGVNPVPVVNIHYENMHNILSYGRNLTTQPVSQVLSSQVARTSDLFYTSSDGFVQLTFHYNLSQYSEINASTLRCGFWNFSLNDGRGDWDTEGVTVIRNSREDSTIICNSTHLTSFAVLVDVSGGHEKFSSEEREILSVISYIGCGISIVCLLLTIAVLLYYKKSLLKQIQNFVHLNLATALLMALLIFVGGIERARESEIACTVVAASLHYFFTAVFSWMLCEGIMLYFLLVKVFYTGLGERKSFYFVLGWGIPIPIVAVTAGIAHDQYGHDEFCWMDTGNESIWAFVAPMLAIISINIVFLILTIISVIKNTRRKMAVKEVSQLKVVKTVLKATVILLPLLGITWVFGLLAITEESSVFAWVFTILNSLQGLFIFTLHVIRNEKIWKKLSSCWRKRIFYSSMSSIRQSPNSSKHRSKNLNDQHSSDTIKLDLKLDTKTSIIISDCTLLQVDKEIKKDTTPESNPEEAVIATLFPTKPDVANTIYETDM